MAEITEMGEPISGLPARLRRVAHLAQRRIGEETVVIDLRRGRVYGFNLAGGELLELLREGRRTEDLLAWARGEGEREWSRFVSTLIESELVAADAGEPAAAPPLPAGGPGAVPRLLWQENVARVTNQISPPQAITNPQCQP
jgi:hypothetical protein